MKDIRIEEVGDINFEYPYLEVFLKDSVSPFLEVGISVDRELFFKFYPSKDDVSLQLDDWEFILSAAKDFLPKALKNEDDFLDFFNE